MRKESSILVLLLALCAVTTALNPRFVSAVNLLNTANMVGLFGLLSLGLGVVIIAGGIELSVGSMLALTGVLLSMALTGWGAEEGGAAAGAVALPMALGWVHGALVTRLNIQPFIVTLCGLLLYRGLARFVAGESTKGFGDAAGFEALQTLARGKVLGLPAPFVVLLVVSAIMWVVLHRSVYGRYLFAVGRNEAAARLSGINTRRVVVSSYVIAGALTGVAGILFAFYTNSISPSTHGNFYELYGIAAAVVGGCSLRGGEGSVAGILIGTALLQVLQNLVNLLGIDSSLNFAVMGGVVLVGVMADEWFARRRARGTCADARPTPSPTGGATATQQRNESSTTEINR
ncbi:MAG: ABC transporter permease [Verrucomicrobiae bacterium]|nr:ABC transporter permease [Verrucomicrobiae bacterium]